MFFSISKAVEWLPDPVVWAAPLLVVAILLRKRVAAAVAIAIAALLLPAVFASPMVASSFERWAEGSVRSSVQPGIEYDAAIVLSGEPEERIGAAAGLVETGRARFLLYSGAVDPGEAKRAMAKLRSHGVREDRVVFEASSRNTRENAVQSARVVAERGWKRLVLVTGALHARRALACFRKVGLNPDLLPAMATGPQPEARLLPQAQALATSTAVLHELVGYIAYRAAGYVD